MKVVLYISHSIFRLIIWFRDALFRWAISGYFAVAAFNELFIGNLTNLSWSEIEWFQKFLAIKLYPVSLHLGSPLLKRLNNFKSLKYNGTFMDKIQIFHEIEIWKGSHLLPVSFKAEANSKFIPIDFHVRYWPFTEPWGNMLTLI